MENEEWFAMRDLKRVNANLPAWKMLTELGFEVFTPMHWRFKEKNGKRIKKYVPVVQDLLFVHSDRHNLDPVVMKTPTLQYRFVKNASGRPMTVRDDDMNRFINAINNTENVRYYLPEELGPEIIGKSVRITGGPLAEYEGNILKIKGSRTKRLIVEIPHFLYACVEIKPEYIQFI